MAGIYFKDSTVGSFKYSSNAVNPLILYNNVKFDLNFNVRIGNTYSILFKVTSLNLKSGVLQKYILSRRTMLENEVQWGSWEVLLEKDCYADGGYFEENSFNEISNSSFTVNKNKYQFKIEFFDLNDIIGVITNDSQLTNSTIYSVDVIPTDLIPVVENFSFTMTNDSIPIAVGNLLYIPIIGDYLPVYDKIGYKCFVNLYPLNSNGKINLPSKYVSLLSGYDYLELKTAASFLVNDGNRAYYTLSELQFYGGIYKVPLVKYSSNYKPEPLDYNATSFQLTTQDIDVYFSLPNSLYEYDSEFSPIFYDKLDFLNIKEESVEMDIPYLNNYFYKNTFIKVYLFIPNDKYDQDAPVDANPINTSNLGKWYFKEQVKLSTIEKVDSFVDVESSSGSFFYYAFNEYKLKLANLPKKGEVFYIWLGLGFQSPYDLLKSNYVDVANIPIWQ